MKRLVLLFSIFLVIFAINLSAQKDKDAPKPKLVIVGGDTYDWGLVSPKDNPLKSVIIIKNEGNAPLKITKVKPACGCTTAPLNKSELAPGDTTAINITLRIGSRASSVHKTVRIASNDPVSPNKILHLKCKVFLPLELSPTPYFTFNPMKVGTESKSTLKLKNNTKKTVTLSDIEIKPADMIVNIKPGQKIKPGQIIEITARYKPKKAGYFNCSVKMKTTAKDMPSLYISGYGNVQESSIFNN
jgi:hypothetical protein